MKIRSHTLALSLALLAVLPTHFSAADAAQQPGASGSAGTMSILQIYRTDEKDAADLIGRFIPDGAAGGAVSEKSAFRSPCSSFFSYRNVAASGQHEDILRSGDLIRRVEYDIVSKLQATIPDPAALEKCCRAHPGACTRRYVDSVLRGELFDRTESSSRKTIRDTKGEKYFAFLTAEVPIRNERAARCGGGDAWTRILPESVDGFYVVGSAPSGAGFGQAGRNSALADAQKKAAAALKAKMSAARTDVEKSMGKAAVSKEDETALVRLSQRYAEMALPECWSTAASASQQDASAKVLALISQSTIDSAYQEALKFFADRTNSALDSTLASFLRELASALPTASASLPIYVALAEDGTADADLDGNVSRRSKWLTERIIRAVSSSKELAGHQVKSSLNDATAGKSSKSSRGAANAARKKDGASGAIVLKASAETTDDDVYLNVSMSADLSAAGAGSSYLPLGSARIPASVFPENESARGEVLSIRLDKSPRGTLCLGEKTALRVHVKKRLYVQIWSLSGKNCDEAVLVYPADSSESGFVDPSAPFEIQDLVAMPSKGSKRECVLAVAAESKLALGDLANFQGCRMGRERTASLLDMGKLADPDRHIFVARDEYILAPASDCRNTAVEDIPQGGSADDALASIPLCR